MKPARIIGATNEAIAQAETELQVQVPVTFRTWLALNNGLGIGEFNVFPVFDSRDPRKTWDSIVRNFKDNWASWVSNFPDLKGRLSRLLPFAGTGTGDFICFDYLYLNPDQESTVVLWSHETGEPTKMADSFQLFLLNASGESTLQ